MTNDTVRLTWESQRLELEWFGRTSTVADLVQAVGRACATEHRAGPLCKRCGKCCAQEIPVVGMDLAHLERGTGSRSVSSYLVLPGKRHEARSRRQVVVQLTRDLGVSQEDAERLHDFNNGDPAVLAKGANGECTFLCEGLCSIYGYRPLGCRLFHCKMGGRLSILHESIVRAGTWDLYSRLGMIEGKELSQNPFVGKSEWSEVLLSSLMPGEVQLSPIVESCL